MLPGLHPGDGVIAVRTRRARTGQVRVFEHPDRSDFWLVKRVGRVSGERFEAVSDNQAVASVDSRSFGPVAVAGTYRVVARVPARWLTRGHGSSDSR